MTENIEPSGTRDLANLETPITGEIPDDAVAGAQVPGDGGSGPSTEGQIVSDADETNQDMDEPNIDLTESSGMTENTEDVAWPEQGTSIEQDPSATLGESDETKPV